MQVGGAVLGVEVSLCFAFGTGGVDDVEEVAGGLGEVGGVQPPGLGQQGLLGQLPEVRAVGSSSIASQMTAACSGETSPSRSASRVAVRSPTRSLAWRTVRRPVRGWVPAVWVYQSPVEDQARCCLAILRSSTSASAAASTAARCARNVWHAVTVSMISSGALAAQRVSSREPSTAFAARDRGGAVGRER